MQFPLSKIKTDPNCLYEYYLLWSKQTRGCTSVSTALAINVFRRTNNPQKGIKRPSSENYTAFLMSSKLVPLFLANVWRITVFQKKFMSQSVLGTARSNGSEARRRIGAWLLFVLMRPSSKLSEDWLDATKKLRKHRHRKGKRWPVPKIWLFCFSSWRRFHKLV